jgi:hypothetical protein
MDNTTLLIIIVIAVAVWFLVIQPNMNRTTPTPSGGMRQSLPNTTTPSSR